MSRSRSYGKGEVSDTVIADIERRFTGFAVPDGEFRSLNGNCGPTQEVRDSA